METEKNNFESEIMRNY